VVPPSHGSAEGAKITSLKTREFGPQLLQFLLSSRFNSFNSSGRCLGLERLHLPKHDISRKLNLVNFFYCHKTVLEYSSHLHNISFAVSSLAWQMATALQAIRNVNDGFFQYWISDTQFRVKPKSMLHMDFIFWFVKKNECQSQNASFFYPIPGSSLGDFSHCHLRLVWRDNSIPKRFFIRFAAWIPLLVQDCFSNRGPFNLSITHPFFDGNIFSLKVKY